MKKLLYIFICGVLYAPYLWAVPMEYYVGDCSTWTTNQLSNRIGDTLRLMNDWYITSNYNTYRISPRRIYSPTNQATPLSSDYNTIVSLNNQGSVQVSGVSGYHRTGERLHNALVKVNSSNSMTLISGEWQGNSRSDILQGNMLDALDRRGTHTLLVCATNLEYYLATNFGTGFGPENAEEHQAQRQKVSSALAKIRADIYCVLEVERGQKAMAELASDLSEKTGRNYRYINDGSHSYGSYIKTGYIYCSDVVDSVAPLRQNQAGVDYRKYMQCFREKSSGERFILSTNHFKAKSGQGSGDNADKGDGQGSFNGDRVREAESVLNEYDYYQTLTNEEDILIMGDLNAYAKEDPIQVFLQAGFTDLHRYFHADSSYSYTYRSEAGYLDHAICNSSLLPQVTGMLAYHINSDERDCYTYDGGCNDGSIFRYSDHDPVLVGLRLRENSSTDIELVLTPEFLYTEDGAHIRNAEGGLVRIYNQNGLLITEQPISSNDFSLHAAYLRAGIYIVHIYGQNKIIERKLIIH